MNRVNIIQDLGLEYLYDENTNKKQKINQIKKQRLVKVTEAVFESFLDEGLIQKTDDGYVFVGKRPKKR